jgi:hypothetical protein
MIFNFGQVGVSPSLTTNEFEFYWYDSAGTSLRKGSVGINLRVDNIGTTYVDNTLTIGDTLKVSRRAGIAESGGVVIAPSATTTGPSAALDIQNFAPSTFSKSLRVFSNTNTSASTIAEFRSTSNEVLRLYGDSSMEFNVAKISTGDFRVNGQTDSYLFYSDASADRVGFGTNTPQKKVHIVGDIRIDGTTSASSSGSSGTFLTINVGGTDYKLDLHTV